MSAEVFYDDASDVFRVRDERGRVMADHHGDQLAFDTRQAAEEMVERRAELHSLPARPLREYL